MHIIYSVLFYVFQLTGSKNETIIFFLESVAKNMLPYLLKLIWWPTSEDADSSPGCMLILIHERFTIASNKIYVTSALTF